MKENNMKTEKKNSEARLRANAKYDAANAAYYSLKANRKTDADIIAWMEGIDNKQSYLKELIRADIAKKE